MIYQMVMYRPVELARVCDKFAARLIRFNLVAGQHYYVATYLRPLLFVSNYRLKQHTCQEAREC
jgi:hypothetical protein